MNNFDLDPIETKEWLDAFYSLIAVNGVDRASFILRKLLKTALVNECNVVPINTEYTNTRSSKMDIIYPGNIAIEQRILAIIRWNAIAMVVKVNKEEGLGGHLSTYASAAVLYEVGFNHFWHADDLIFMQGHAAPGIYARAFLEGRFSKKQLANFRQEAFADGLSSYPHPWLMPKFWQFSTVSMGLGPIQAIYQARFNRYLYARHLADPSHKKVWCFCGDGEMDEPESIAALSLAAREKLDNLIFVINCNLQRLDGPVRGNGKIISELESIFLGAGWNVIKVLWNSKWDTLIEKDQSGLLLQLMEETIDGQYQCFNAKDGAYLREHFFGKYPELKKLVANLSDQELSELEFGGHDFNKVYQAYRAAVSHKNQPTVIIAKTVKGYGLGAAGEGLNTAHSVKKLSNEQLTAIKNRFNLPLNDQQLSELEFYNFASGSAEQEYLLDRRKALGGSLPVRRERATKSLEISHELLNDYIHTNTDTPIREISTTMAFVRILGTLSKDRTIGKYLVPIVADEARTFGMEALFRQLSIYAPFGQLYKPVDSDQVMFYKEEKNGQILQEGLTESGAFCSWLAAATSYSNHDRVMMPFYIFYSMFGFQRIADLIWAAADMRARGFLLGATAGRTTLSGEGLQHCDGQSHVFAGTVPNCLSYDPTFSYELAVIIQNGLQKMFQQQQDVFYYITVMNENYPQPHMPDQLNIKEDIVKGMYLFKEDLKYSLQVQLLGSGAILNEVIAAQAILHNEWKVSANVWSVTSFNILAKEARTIREHKLFNNNSNPQQESHLHKCLKNRPGPIIAATDYIRQYVDQIREFIPNRYIVLGTDGFGPSDTRKNLRKFFKVSREHIVVAALQGLVEDGKLDPKILQTVHEKYTNL